VTFYGSWYGPWAISKSTSWHCGQGQILCSVSSFESGECSIQWFHRDELDSEDVSEQRPQVPRYQKN